MCLTRFLHKLVLDHSQIMLKWQRICLWGISSTLGLIEVFSLVSLVVLCASAPPPSLH